MPTRGMSAYQGHGSNVGPMGTLTTGIGGVPFFGPVDHLAKISRSPDDAKGSLVIEADWPSLGSTLWSDTDLPPSSSKTYRDSSPAIEGETWQRSSVAWQNSGMAWRTGFSTLATSECPSGDDGSSSSACEAIPTTLADVLQPSAPQRFYLSARAAQGILRRAAKRGRMLPTALQQALVALSQPAKNDSMPTQSPSSSAPSESTSDPEAIPDHSVISTSPDASRVRAPDGLAGRLDDREQVADTLNSGGNNGGFRTEPGAHLVAVRRATRAHSADDADRWERTDEAGSLNGWDLRHGDGNELAIGSGMSDADDDLLPLGLDSHRYRCCGNGVVAPVAEWLGARLMQALG